MNIMFIRVEQIKRRENQFCVIDENNKYIGDINKEDFFDCIDIDKTFQEDGYAFYFTNKAELLSKIIKKEV